MNQLFYASPTLLELIIKKTMQFIIQTGPHLRKGALLIMMRGQHACTDWSRQAGTLVALLMIYKKCNHPHLRPGTVRVMLYVTFFHLKSPSFARSGIPSFLPRSIHLFIRSAHYPITAAYDQVYDLISLCLSFLNSKMGITENTSVAVALRVKWLNMDLHQNST